LFSNSSSNLLPAELVPKAIRPPGPKKAKAKEGADSKTPPIALSAACIKLPLPMSSAILSESYSLTLLPNSIIPFSKKLVPCVTSDTSFTNLRAFNLSSLFVKTSG
jgi:hypothetical protein